VLFQLVLTCPSDRFRNSGDSRLTGTWAIDSLYPQQIVEAVGLTIYRLVQTPTRKKVAERTVAEVSAPVGGVLTISEAIRNEGNGGAGRGARRHGLPADAKPLAAGARAGRGNHGSRRPHRPAQRSRGHLPQA